MLVALVRRSALGAALTAAVLAAPVSDALAASRDDGPYHVTIRRTAHGIPHVVAGDYASLGYGYAYAFAQDAICTMADQYVTVSAQRAATFGPDGTYDLSGANGTRPYNLASDLFYAKINKLGTVEGLIATPPAQGGPEPEVAQVVKGYTAGWNAYLADVGGPSGITDPACKGKDWVRPLQEIDVWRRFYQLSLLASSGVAIQGIADAAPVLPTQTPAAEARAEQAATSPQLKERLDDVLGGLGSNAIALGKDATPDGDGLLLGNPHFPWKGTERFYQSQLTIPGKIDVSGGSLYGAPVINIGFTKGLAWSHTVSTARRFVPYEVQLVPGDPYSYVVDGQVKKMQATTVTVQSRQADGSLKPVTRTLYDTEYGPMLTSILGLPIFPWTPTSGYALYDGNATNFGRLFNHFFDVDRAQSVDELDAIEKRWQGIPWVNTIATDRTGKAYYADIGSMPNVPAAKQTACQTALGAALDAASRLIVLDGSRGSCTPAAGGDAGGFKAGLLPADKQPQLTRSDDVTNSNDSYWLTNPAQPLEGFPRLIGDERTARSPRTRLGLTMVREALAGGGKVTPQQLMDLAFNNRTLTGEQWRDPLVAACTASPTMVGTNGPVDVSGACAALKAWDLRLNTDSRGAALFQRFAARALAIPGGPWGVPFSDKDPVGSPAGLATGNPLVQQALADAVSDLQGAGLALDSPFGMAQFERRGTEQIPIGGGPGTLGAFNAINTVWDPKTAYAGVPHGSSYVQVVRVTGQACPDAHTILTYSESPDPTSPWYADQTRMFSKKQWVDVPFCDTDVAADRALTVQNLGGGYKGYAQTGTPAKLLRSVRVARAGRRGLRVTAVTGGRATLRIRVLRGTKAVRSLRRTVSKAGTTRVLAARLPAGRFEVTVKAAGVPGSARVTLARKAPALR